MTKDTSKNAHDNYDDNLFLLYEKGKSKILERTVSLNFVSPIVLGITSSKKAWKTVVISI